MGRGVPDISLAVIENNVVILKLRETIAYLGFSAALFQSGAVHG